MQKIIIASKLLICAVIVAFLFLYPSRCVLSEEAEKSQSQQTPEMKGYNYNLKELLGKVEQNLKEVDKKLKEEEAKKYNEEREATIRKHFEEGNRLYQESKFKEAKQQWQKALEISKDPEMKGYIKKAESRAKEEELARKKEEQERQKQLEAEAKETERVEKEKQKQLELAKKGQENKAKEEQGQQKRLETEAKEKERKLIEQAKTTYNEAISLYNSKNYEQAKTKFTQVAKLIPNYAGTASYLRRIPQDIQKEKERIENEKKRQEELARKEQEKQQKLEQARSEKEKIQKETELKKQQKLEPTRKEQVRSEAEKKHQEELARKKEEQERQKQLVAEQKEKERLAIEKKRQEELVQTKKIDSICKNAIALYNKNQFEEASSLFNQILSLDPEHRIAKDYLNKKIPNRVKQLEVTQKREEERMQTAERKRSEKQIQEKQELKKESKAEAKDKKIDTKVEESNSILNETARAIYKEAIALYNSGEYTQAKAKFEQIKQIAPNHPNTDYYLGRIPQKIAEHKERTEAQNKQEEETTKRKEIASLSNRAISFYDEGKLAEAAALFKQILSLDPENKRAKYYLENKIPTDVTKLPESEQGKQDMGKVKKERKQKEEQANKKEEQEQQKKLAVKAREKELQLNEQAKTTYNEAVSLYRVKNYEQAQVKFEQVAKLIPNYAGTASYLRRIPQDIQKERERIENEKRRQEELARTEEKRRQIEEQARLEKEKKRLEQEKLKKEQELKREEERLGKEKQLELQKIEQQRKQKESKSVPNRKIESLYKKAISLYDQDQLYESKVLFLDILSLDPTQPRALDYINKKIPNRIKELQKEDMSR